MPSEFPRSPNILKGALVVFELAIPVPTNVIVFQYNPESMSRTFEPPLKDKNPKTSSGAGQNLLPPIESFQMTVELDAADQLESPGSNPLTVAAGLYPTLAALELLQYPTSKALILNKALALVGSSMISSAQAPMVLLVWGPFRVIPVCVTSMSITEQAFDTLLNPILAKVELGLRALYDDELKQAGPPFDTLALVNQVGKEALARLNVVNSVQQVTGLLPF